MFGVYVINIHSRFSNISIRDVYHDSQSIGSILWCHHNRRSFGTYLRLRYFSFTFYYPWFNTNKSLAFAICQISFHSITIWSGIGSFKLFQKHLKVTRLDYMKNQYKDFMIATRSAFDLVVVLCIITSNFIRLTFTFPIISYLFNSSILSYPACSTGSTWLNMMNNKTTTTTAANKNNNNNNIELANRQQYPMLCYSNTTLIKSSIFK